MASGLVGERYTFLGYVPRSAPARAALWAELAGWTWPAVAFESPKRLPRTLASLAAADPERSLAICRELTKRFEEVVRGSAGDLAERFPEPPRGEITLVIGAPAAAPAPVDADAAVAAVSELAAAGASRRRAAQVVARLAGLPANELYRRSLS